MKALRRSLARLRSKVIDGGVVTATNDLRHEASHTPGDLAELRGQVAHLSATLSDTLATLEQRSRSLDHDVMRVRQQLRYLAQNRISGSVLGDARDLTPFEISVFSQNGEDGVLLEILRRVGAEERFFVEVGATQFEANCIVLADLLGWSGCFIEADPDRAEALRRKYSGVPDVRVVQAFVDRSNINEVLQGAGTEVGVDVFSMDIDGNDYWVWEAMDVVRPRIVVVEYNAALGPAKPLVQEYQPELPWDGTVDFGASREALVHLGGQKGYTLVHADIAGVNAFFVRSDLHNELFPDPDAVVRRGTNYFLSGQTHPPSSGRRRFLDPTAPWGDAG